MTMENHGQNGNVIRVGIAEGAVVQVPWRIRTTGLGSCVGVVLFDRQSGYSGMVHVMLPSAPDSQLSIPCKYADTAISWLIGALLARGCVKAHLKAKLAGGAQMFAASIKSDLMRVGPRNIEAVQRELEIARIPILAQDVGGSVGRTIEFDPVTGALEIRTALHGISVI